MESTPMRKPLAFFLAALLAVSLVPFAGAAYADPVDGGERAEEVAAGETAATTDDPGLATDAAATPRTQSGSSSQSAVGDGIDALAVADAVVTNFGELQAAITAITSDNDPKGTIIIGQDFAFDSAIDIDKPCEILIQGNGNTLTAASSRHFQVFSLANVTIVDTVLDGGTTAGGINLINKGALALERTTMQNCSAPSGRDGGAINTYGNTAADAVTLTISDNCLFKDNVANATNPHSAGAISLRRNTVFTMSDTVLEGNTARGTGGAMHIIGSSTAQNVQATFTNVTFDDNESLDSQAGGIAIKDYATVVFDKCTFTNNKALWSGGGLFADRYCDITITDCVFTGNESSGSNQSSGGGLGLGLYDNAATAFTMTGTLIEGNTATRGGGVTFSSFTDYEISDCTIIDNAATNEGGGVYVSSAVSGTLPTSVTIADSEISGNTATNGGGLFGGQYKTFNSQIKLEGTTVSDNAATEDGGGVHMQDATLATLFADAATVFSGNTAATLHDLTDPALIATHGTNILTDTKSTQYVAYAYNNYDVNQVLGPQIVLSTITYDANGGTGDDFSETVLTSSTYAAKTAAELGFSKGTDQFLYWTTTADAEDPSAQIYREGETVALSSDGSAVTLYAQWKAEDPTEVLSIARLFGNERYKTAQQVATYDRDISTEPVLIVASGHNYNFPDALAASSLSGASGNAPILLTDPSSLPSSTREALVAATSASKVYIIGDTPSVSASVEAEIAQILPTAQIERLAGATRMQTAELIYGEIETRSSDTAIIARSMDFPDSLSVSSWAAYTNSPIFLTDFSEQGLTQGTLDALARGGFTRVLVLGSELSVPASVVEQAISASGLSASDVVRLGGIDRVDTSVKIAEWATDPSRGTEQLSYDKLAITRSDSHSDALAGGALQGMHGSVILLTSTAVVHPGVLSAIAAAEAEINEIRFFGDENAVAVDTMRSYVKAIQFDQPSWKPDDSVAFDLN